MKVLKDKKKGGKSQLEEFDLNKIINAVKKAYASQGKEPDDVVLKELNYIPSHHEGASSIGVETIQAEVEKILMDLAPYDVAKAYIIYKAKHDESRLIKSRIDYMEGYSNSKDNASSSSETDPNSNVSSKNVANLEGEVYKSTNRIIQRQRMKDMLYRIFPEVAKQYEIDLEHHIIYTHDEASTPVLKPYTYSPKESVYAKIGNKPVLCSFESLYNLCDSTQYEVKEGVYQKRPTNIKIKDKDGWTNVTVLTKKRRERDLYRVKTSFGEDVIVTDNHPMIVGDTIDNTIDAKDCVNYTQLRLANSLEFNNIESIDVSSVVDVDYSTDSFVVRHDTFAPYLYTKRTVPINRELGYVIGFFIGNGNYDNNYHNLIFSQKERSALTHIENYLFNCFGVVSSITLNQNNIWVLCVHSDIVYDIFKNYFKIKDKAWNRCLPYNLLEFGDDFARGIIEGIIDSDGCVQGNSINIRLSSREAITQLTILLKYFGYGVANSIQYCPFGQNKAVKTNYTLWEVQFTNKPDTIKFDKSYKFNTTSETSSCLKYKEGKALVTDSTKLENCSFMELCDFIYDITTESHSLMCNNLWMHNCMAVTLYPLMLEGVGNIDGVTPTEPNDIQSFSGQITNLAFLLSSQCKGAVAFGDYFIALNYYVAKEFGPKWYEKLDCKVTSPHCLISRTIRSAIEKGMKQFIWGVNQPAGNRSYNSPFTNISWYDKYYFESLFGDFYYPDGTQPEWKAIDTLQRMSMKLMRDIRLIKPITFPVTTIALVHNNKEFLDRDYKELCAEEWSKGGSFFCYNSDNPTSLASCCRVLNEMSDNIFSSTTGMTGVMTGSCNVITLNLNRIIQDFYKENNLEEFRKNKDIPYVGLRTYIQDILERVFKYHIAYKTMLYDMEDKGMLASSNGGYIYIKKLYSTIGVIGYFEAAKFLGINTNNNEEYKKFLSIIFNVIKEEVKAHNINDKKRPFLFNIEAIPGENLGVKLYEWDKKDGYIVPEDQNLYNCYFYNPWDDTSVLDKIKLHGRQVSTALSGGQACHINLDTHLSKEQYLKLMDIAKEEGCNYYTFNIPISECKECHHIVNAPIKECPICHSKSLKYYTRIIGYLTAVDNWSSPRQEEFEKRIYEHIE